MVFDGSDEDRHITSTLATDDLRSVWRYLLVSRQFAASVSAILERYVCPADTEGFAAWASGLAHGRRAGRAEWLVLSETEDRDLIAGVMLVALPFLSNLRALDVPVMRMAVQRRLADAMGAMPSLCEIGWWDNDDPADSHDLVGLDAVLVGRSAALRRLFLHRVDIAAAVTLPDVHFNALLELDLNDWREGKHEQVVHLVRNITAAAPRLRYLSLQCEQAWAGADLVEVVRPLRDHLRVLTLDVDTAADGDASGPAFDDRSAMAVILAACTALETLQVPTMGWLDRDCLRGVGLRRLRTLAIVRGAVVAADLLSLGSLMGIGKLRRLVLAEGAIDQADEEAGRLDAFTVRQNAPAAAQRRSTCANLTASTSAAPR